MNKIDKIIDWFRQRTGKVTYSMDKRTGPHSYDCSSSVYYAVCEALGLKAEYPKNTATLPEFLLKNGFERIAVNHEWTAKRGDVVIWAKQKGVAGAKAHTGVFTDNSHIIHCNYDANGISENTEKYLLSLYNWNYEVYRLVEKAGWEQEEDTGKWWYRLPNSDYSKNSWSKISDEWYYFDEKGYAYQNRWLKYKENWYYFDNSCKMVFNGWKKIKDEWYYFNEDGIALSEKWFKYKNEWYYFDKDCKMVHDKFITVGNETFYFNDWGVCDLNYVRNIDGKQYAFNERGALIKNKIIEENGSIENLKK